MASGTTLRMWRRTLILLVLLIGVGFGLILFNLIRLQLVEGAEIPVAGSKPAHHQPVRPAGQHLRLQRECSGRERQRMDRGAGAGLYRG